MKNIIILGSGRSGTSMVAGIFAKSGYFMGDELLEPSAINPKGFFEDKEVNSINEKILSLVLPKRYTFWKIDLFRHRPVYGLRWLSWLDLNTKLKTNYNIDSRIENIIRNKVFCFKDPRFSYTLPVWKPFLENCVFICIFRDPGSTILSMQNRIKELPKRKNGIGAISLNKSNLYNIWNMMYTHILRKHRNEGKWLFIHYNQVFSNEGLLKLQDHTGAEVDPTFPDKNIRKHFSSDKINKNTLNIYNELCNLADFKNI